MFIANSSRKESWDICGRNNATACHTNKQNVIDVTKAAPNRCPKLYLSMLCVSCFSAICDKRYDYDVKLTTQNNTNIGYSNFKPHGYISHLHTGSCIIIYPQFTLNDAPRLYHQLDSNLQIKLAVWCLVFQFVSVKDSLVKC